MRLPLRADQYSPTAGNGFARRISSASYMRYGPDGARSALANIKAPVRDQSPTARPAAGLTRPLESADQDTDGHNTSDDHHRGLNRIRRFRLMVVDRCLQEHSSSRPIAGGHRLRTCC